MNGSEESLVPLENSSTMSHESTLSFRIVPIASFLSSIEESCLAPEILSYVDLPGQEISSGWLVGKSLVHLLLQQQLRPNELAPNDGSGDASKREVPRTRNQGLPQVQIE